MILLGKIINNIVIMMNTENKNGILYFDNTNTVELTNKYGTPLYVMSVNEIKTKIDEFRECFLDKYPNTRLAYASKSFLPIAMCTLLNKEGMCLEVVSGGEIYTAMKAGFPPERMEFNGNNKSIDELEMAVDIGVGRIIIDSEDELPIIESVCEQKGRRVNALIRVNPGVDVHTHKHMSTGNRDSKFGIDIGNGALSRVIERAIESCYINLLGFHYHVGANIYENEPYIAALDIVLELVKKVKNEYDFTVSELNVGGGFAATFTEDKKHPPYSYYLEPLMQRIMKFSNDLGIERPAVVIEPGRALTAEAGMTLYTVGSVKNIPGVRKYVSIDGGMTDNIRVALYDAKYEGIIANKADEPADDLVTVCGKCCESGDIVARDIKLAKAERGDIFALYATGCYCQAMASNYNKIPKAAVVMIRDGKDQLIVKRQTYEDMISNEILVDDIL